MDADELNERIKFLIQSVSNLQEFADLTSPEENWRKIDKSIKIPKYIGLKEEYCPICFETVRLMFDKFASDNSITELICPHCKSILICKNEFTGYTSDVILIEK